MMLVEALSYPLRGKGAWSVVWRLAFVQLVPVVGQLVLLGYGFEIVRMVYEGRERLPPVRWGAALWDGVRFVLACMFYMVPIVLTVAMIGASSLGISGGLGNLGGVGVLFAVGLPLVLAVVGIVVRKVGGGKRKVEQNSQAVGERKGDVRVVMARVVPIIGMVALTFVISALVSSSGIQAGKPNWLAVVVYVVFGVLIFLIRSAVYIGGVRSAIAGKGLFDATGNAKLLFKQRGYAGVLLVNVLVLSVIEVVVTMVGGVLLVVPGLIGWVVCELAVWFLFAEYGKKTGIAF